MLDKNGADIVVGSRVREADFGYGDGEVESVTVPIRGGGGFNVGVRWDDPSLGGPEYDAEGGGRGAQHLVVLQEAEGGGGGLEAMREYQDWELNSEKRQRFKERFKRGPRESEDELSERDWDEIDEEEDANGGALGGEGGGEEGGDQGGVLAALLAAGSRIKLSMGQPAKWYGALVGATKDDGIEIGFDDGDIQLWTLENLKDVHEAAGLVAAVPSEGGVVANKHGYPAATSFLTFEHRSKKTVIGLFIAEAPMPMVAGLPIYAEVHVRLDAFEQKRVRGAQSVQDRQGLHTFVRGNIVEYSQADKGEVPP